MLRADWTFNKTSAIGRLLTLSAVCGVLVAAMVLPVVAASGILVRNQANSFTTISLQSNRGLPQRSELLDRNGHLLTYIYGVDLGPGMTYSGINRAPVAPGQIAKVMQQAIVAIEDDRYWSHGAIDMKGLVRAVVNDLEHKPVQGGSTITQQYVKDLLIVAAGDNQAMISQAQAKTLSRKLTELRMAVSVEHNMSKLDILTGYLNDAFFGNGATGIEAAAETYFSTSASNLSLTQAATLAGIVENPSAYDPVGSPTLSLERRNTVLARMAQTGAITFAAAAKAEKTPLGVHAGGAESGCMASIVGNAAFFCDYVVHAFLLNPAYGKTTQDRAKLLATGGLRIYTTLDSRDQRAASNAVNYVLPASSHAYNPSHNAATEVLIQPGTGAIRAIAEDRQYGTGRGETEVDYAVNSDYGGAAGVQTGSSSKLFTLVTALKQGVPFGFTQTVPGSTTINGYTNCKGAPAGFSNGVPGAYQVTNSEGPGKTTDSLYTGTTRSINVFYAQLEKKVGLCNVVHTAADLGVTKADGTSLLSGRNSADNVPSFTLGAVAVSPMSMAAAYATMAAQGKYCAPVAITSVTTGLGKTLPGQSANCHQAVSKDVANAVNYILSGVFSNGGTAAPPQGPGGLSRPAAGKTGTSNIESGNGTPYAAFAGYTPTLASYTSVFNPISPQMHPMTYTSACYRLEFGGQNCPQEMFGANAPATTWHMTFDHASLGSAAGFVPVPQSSELWSQGDGQTVKQPKHGGGGGGGGHHHKHPGFPGFPQQPLPGGLP